VAGYSVNQRKVKPDLATIFRSLLKFSTMSEKTREKLVSKNSKAQSPQHPDQPISRVKEK
jgi:hypothetical protein